MKMLEINDIMLRIMNDETLRNLCFYAQFPLKYTLWFRECFQEIKDNYTDQEVNECIHYISDNNLTEQIIPEWVIHQRKRENWSREYNNTLKYGDYEGKILRRQEKHQED
jgi:hypothetical protein